MWKTRQHAFIYRLYAIKFLKSKTGNNSPSVNIPDMRDTNTRLSTACRQCVVTRWPVNRMVAVVMLWSHGMSEMK